MPAGNVRAEIGYTEDTGKQPYFYANAHEKDDVPLKPAAMDITDARGVDTSLDREGFILVQHASAVEDLTDLADGEDPDETDGVDAADPDEVELEYVGDLNDVAAAASAAQALEADSLSDADLRELDYKDEFTRDEDEAAASPR